MGGHDDQIDAVLLGEIDDLNGNLLACLYRCCDLETLFRQFFAEDSKVLLRGFFLFLIDDQRRDQFGRSIDGHKRDNLKEGQFGIKVLGQLLRLPQPYFG